MTIKNLETILNELVEMLMQFDRDLNSYDTDVYLYYYAETETASLSTFVNVGGNSWLDDNHYTIYTDRQHYDTFLDFWNDIAEFAESLGMTEDKLISLVAEYFRYEPEEIDYHDVRKFFNYNEEYFDKLKEEYCGFIESLRSEYVERADDIMDRFFAYIADCEHVQKYGY